MLRVHLGERSYDIAIREGEGEDFGRFVYARCPGSLALVVTDTNARRHAEGLGNALLEAKFRVEYQVLPPGETEKNLDRLRGIYDFLAELKADRKTVVVAVGGGVIGDLAGFAAATYARGLPLVMVPTTLLSMVDSSVGGKVGINHSRGKNLIGAFHQPRGVWIDPDVLSTLPDREYRSGLAEVVKYGVILDAVFFAYLEQHIEPILGRDRGVVSDIVGVSCRLKASVVEQDEREETGLRMILNYGHTFAHAFEAVAGYGTWLHGEAVSAGMICASRLAEHTGLVDFEVTQRQLRLLEAFQLPTAPPPCDFDALLASMYSDKKALAGRLRFILPTRLGEVKLFENIAEADVRAVLENA